MADLQKSVNNWDNEHGNVEVRFRLGNKILIEPPLLASVGKHPLRLVFFRNLVSDSTKRSCQRNPLTSEQTEEWLGFDYINNRITRICMILSISLSQLGSKFRT